MVGAAGSLMGVYRFLGGNRRGRPTMSRLPGPILIIAVVVALLSGCAGGSADRADSPEPWLTASHPKLADRAYTVFPGSQTRAWLAAHPQDPRTRRMWKELGDKPSALWLTGDRSDYRNLAAHMRNARRTSTLPIITLYNIPGRNDGLTGPNPRVDGAAYRAWVDRVAARIGNYPSIIIIEPDALWLADRQFGRDRAGFDQRMALIDYAARHFTANPANHVYIEAGTTSGSVNPRRMAQLLRKAGASDRVGFAVNVSSFSPQPAIVKYATEIRGHLARQRIDARYVVDTSRNGNPRWDYTWCNPPGRTIGAQPGTVTPGADGMDANLWIKAPGTSDGSCGVAPGSVGGQFLPDVAYQSLR